MFIGGFVTGVVTTVFLGPGLHHLLSNLRRIPQLDSLVGPEQLPTERQPPAHPAVRMDHVVIRARSSDGLRRSLDFWMRNFGLESERLEEAGAFIRDPDNHGPAFPSVRINEGTVLDLFPVEMKPYFCKESPESASVDHICLTVPGHKMLEILDNFALNDVPVTKVAGDFITSANDSGARGEFSGPWGAMGLGISVYFYEPNGLYCEVRTYDLEYVKDIRERALPLVVTEPDIDDDIRTS